MVILTVVLPKQGENEEYIPSIIRLYTPQHKRSQDFCSGGAKPKITCNDVIINFQKRNFLWGKDIVEWKI